MTKDEIRFWNKVRIGDGCWMWTGATYRPGPFAYGSFSLGRGCSLGAHRFAYASTHGPIAAGMCVLHICDQPLCVRPGHLRLGTQADNVADMVAKGRNARGDRNGSRSRPERLLRAENHPRARMTYRMADEIRAASGASQVALATRFGVSRRLIARVLRGAWMKETANA